MKYKVLNKEQIIISIDRLTRFKNTQEKYLRVYTDILISNLIEPKLKKNDILNLDYTVITNYATEIINSSIKSIINSDFDYINNKKIINYIAKYENNTFDNSNNTLKLLDNNINYIDAVKLFSEDCPVNIKWLKLVIDNILIDDIVDLRLLREQNNIKFPIEEVLLVEGITEEILLPVFARKLGHDFYKKGIQVIPAGGKNQVVKMYYKLAEELKIPIFVLLDKDAEGNINQIKPKLRKSDRIHLVSCGEFEDLLPKSLIVKTVNSHFKNFLTISNNDLVSSLPMAKLLEEIFKTKGLHEFKKAEFAKLVKENITEKTDISSEIIDIIEEIFSTNKNA